MNFAVSECILRTFAPPNNDPENQKGISIMLHKGVLSCLAVCLIAFAAVAETAEKERVKIEDDVIELQVSPQMRTRIQQAFERGILYEENGVTIIELNEENSRGVLADNDDAIILAPPEDRSSKITLGETLKSAVAPWRNDSDAVTKIARGGAGLMCKAFLVVLPLAVRMGYGLDVMSDGVARALLGKPQRTPKEKEALWNDYAQWEMKIHKSGRSLQYMVLEYDEYVDDRAAGRQPEKAAEKKVPSAVLAEEPPQKVVYLNNIVQTTYVSSGGRKVFVGSRRHLRPRGRRIRHRVHYLPGIRRTAERRAAPPRPIIIRKKRHYHPGSTAPVVHRRQLRRRPKVVLHTKGYRPAGAHKNPVKRSRRR